LPYWLDALSFRIFGFNTFVAHLPKSIAVLLLALLGFHWANRAFGTRTAFYAGLVVLTSIRVFLLTLFLCTSLYCLLRSLESSPRGESGNRGSGTLPSVAYPYLMWASLALAVLTKGLVAIVFLAGTAIAYLILTGDYKKWRALKPLTGTLLFLAIAAPWHIL